MKIIRGNFYDYYPSCWIIIPKPSSIIDFTTYTGVTINGVTNICLLGHDVTVDDNIENAINAGIRNFCILDSELFDSVDSIDSIESIEIYKDHIDNLFIDDSYIETNYYDGFDIDLSEKIINATMLDTFEFDGDIWYSEYIAIEEGFNELYITQKVFDSEETGFVYNTLLVRNAESYNTILDKLNLKRGK